MLKSIILVAALIPTAATAHHEWNQNDWVKALLENHNAVGACREKITMANIAGFRVECVYKLDTMVTEEAKAERLYDEAKAQHPELSHMDFLKESFPGALQSSYEAVFNNVTVIPNVNSRIMDMYILEAVTRGDKY